MLNLSRHLEIIKTFADQNSVFNWGYLGTFKMLDVGELLLLEFVWDRQVPEASL